MKTIVNKKKQIVGLLYGLAAGLAFSIFAWGIDAILIAYAHGSYSFVKFIPGMLISVIIGGLVGWITVRIQNHLISVGVWLLFALMLSRLFIWLPIKAAPWLIKLFDNHLGEYLNYPFYKDMGQINWFGFATIALVAIICALIENILIDQALFSTGKVVLAIPIVVCALCFSLAGNAVDGLFNKSIREPILAVNKLMQFAVDNLDKEVSAEVSRSMHLAAVKTITEYLPRERSLILSNFDQSFGQVDVLVDFDGYWVKCTTVYNQVTFCKPALETPQSLFSHYWSTTMAQSFNSVMIDG